jgi:translation initiation factor 1
MSNKNKNRNGIVYSTDPNYHYDSGEESQETLPTSQQTLYVRREVRSGKSTIAIREFIGNKEDLKDLEKSLKNHCGTGGTSKDGIIYIQGDVAEKIKKYLVSKGYKTKG